MFLLLSHCTSSLICGSHPNRGDPHALFNLEPFQLCSKNWGGLSAWNELKGSQNNDMSSIHYCVVRSGIKSKPTSGQSVLFVLHFRIIFEQAGFIFNDKMPTLLVLSPLMHHNQRKTYITCCSGINPSDINLQR